MKKRIQSVAVLGVTALLIFLVLQKVGLADLVHTLLQADLTYLTLSVLTMPFLVGTSVAKWQLLLKARDVDASFFYLVKLYLVGYFFNNFLPSNVGGDIVRAYELGVRDGHMAKATASVFVERFTGFIVLVMLAALSFLTNLVLASHTVLAVAMLGMGAGLAGVLWLILDPRLLAFIEKRVTFAGAQKYIAKFRRFYEAVRTYKDHRKALVLSFVLSIVFYVFAVLNVYFSSLTFHQPIPLLEIMLIVPIILVVAMVPLTFNGVGVLEWAYVVLYPMIGLPGAIGLSAIVLIRAKNLIAALLGGLFYPAIRLRNQHAVPLDSAVEPQ